MLDIADILPGDWWVARWREVNHEAHFDKVMGYFIEYIDTLPADKRPAFISVLEAVPPLSVAFEKDAGAARLVIGAALSNDTTRSSGIVLGCCPCMMGHRIVPIDSIKRVIPVEPFTGLLVGQLLRARLGKQGMA